MWLAAAASRAAPASEDRTTSARRCRDRYHVKNLHATILNQMGLDPNKLSYSTAASTRSSSVSKARSRSGRSSEVAVVQVIPKAGADDEFPLAVSVCVKLLPAVIGAGR